MRLALERHPASPAAAALALEVDVRRAGAALDLRFALRATPESIRVPAPATPHFEVGLWRHTCFETFLGLDGASAYHEWNLSPSGAWAAHAFRGYRDGGPIEDERLAPRCTVERAAGEVVLEARIDLAGVYAEHAEDTLRVGLAAVVESRDGALEYWALRHGDAKPDFHHAGSFALRLEPSGAAMVIPAP